MNKRMRKMMGKAIVGTTLTAIAVIGAGQMASASGTTGTCVTIGTFTEAGTCTVLAGETVSFNIKAGNGGLGGAGGVGGIGHSGDFSTFPGGAGGLGGIGGGSGAGLRIVGSYINSTGATVTLSIIAGVNGIDGSTGANGVDGSEGDPVGGKGQDGSDGTHGAESILFAGSDLVAGVQGGGGGTGGKGGNGGTQAFICCPGTPGASGENGSRGASGTYFPLTLPDSWILTEDDLSDPYVAFSQDETETTEAETTVPETEILLPATGSNTGPSILVTLLVLACGAVFVVLGRRRVVR